ncbi:MAG: hypothetical protein JNL67_15960 [Planctomycetaceae bacterium]|nr:hypothetical protein [Planctomycetaceae bacterium]
MFVLLAFMSAAMVLVVATNRAIPTSTGEFLAVTEIWATAWAGSHQWNKVIFQVTLWVAIPVAAWLAYGLFGNSLGSFSRQSFVEQRAVRRARVILLMLTVIVLAYNYLRYRKYFEYPYATSIEVDTHANVLRLGLAIAIGQWLFMKAIEKIRRPFLKVALPLAMAWCPLLLEWNFRFIEQLLPIPGFGLRDYVLTFNVLLGMTLFATGFMLILALAKRLPRHEPKEAASATIERSPRLRVGQLCFVITVVGLLWGGGVSLVPWVPHFVEPGILFEDIENSWSVARAEAQLRAIIREEKTTRARQTGHTPAHQPMHLGQSGMPVKVIRIAPDKALDPNLHAALAKLKPGSFSVLVDTAEANYTLTDIVKLQQLGFRDFPPITWEEWQQNPGTISGLYPSGNKVRDSHLNAEALAQLCLISGYHEFTRCTFSPDFIAALNPQTAAHFRFVDCPQTELLDVDLASVEYVYDSLENAPLKLADWRRISKKTEAKIMIRDLPEPLPSYLEMGQRYYFNEVVFVESPDDPAGE